MRTLLSLIALPALLFFSSCSAQIKNAHSTTVRVDGDCHMCETTIEKAAFVKGEAEADWDVDAKTARITIDSTRTDLDAVLQRIAQAGYDSERYLAPDAAYAALPGCCQYERTFKKAPLTTTPVDHVGHEAMATDHTGQSTTSVDTLATQRQANPKSDQFNTLFAAYFAMKDALVASDAKKAAAHASELSAAVKAVQMERMGPDLHDAWMQVMEPLANISAGIATKTDIEAQRKAFAELSSPMLALVKVAPRPEPVYYDHCPMYEGGADWLSQDIKNPFYGSMMLTCGSVKETIAK
jgi:copper chaperone CopZ